jgi:hypothetical protein
MTDRARDPLIEIDVLKAQVAKLSLDLVEALKLVTGLTTALKLIGAQSLAGRTVAAAALLSADELSRAAGPAPQPGPAATGASSPAASADHELVHRHLVAAWRSLQGELGAPGVADEARVRAQHFLANMAGWVGRPIL